MLETMVSFNDLRDGKREFVGTFDEAVDHLWGRFGDATDDLAGVYCPDTHERLVDVIDSAVINGYMNVPDWLQEALDIEDLYVRRVRTD